MANGYITFVVSIAFIGACTAIIGDVAGHLGCFIYLKDGVNAIAFVALGTSVPGIKSFHRVFDSVLSYLRVLQSSGHILVCFIHCLSLNTT